MHKTPCTVLLHKYTASVATKAYVVTLNMRAEKKICLTNNMHVQTIPGVETPDSVLLGPTGDAFPDEESLPLNVTVDTPDALPRAEATGDPLFPASPGAWVNGDGLFFDGSGLPINRDTGQPLPAGTVVDVQGYLLTPQAATPAAAAAAAAGAVAPAPAPAAAAAAAAVGGAPGGVRIGPDGQPMPEDIALPVGQVLTPERRPRTAADMTPIGVRGTPHPTPHFLLCPSVRHH